MGVRSGHIQLRYPDRLARLLLVMAFALHSAVSTGSWDEAQYPTHVEENV